MKKIIIIGLTLLTAACADNKSMIVDYGASNTKAIQNVDPTIGFDALKQAPLCCHSLNQLNYKKISQPGKFDFNISQQSPAFNFNTGKSFVQGVVLPKANGGINISISAPVVSSVFVPTALILDAQYQPMQVYGPETIKYDSSSLLNVDRYFGKINLPANFENGRKAKYLIILTTAEAMHASTELAEPYAAAESLGRNDIVNRIYLDKPIPHTATGIFRLAFDYLPNNPNSAQTMVAENTEQQPQSVTEPDVNSVNKSIQPETEAMFIALIEDAVKNGDTKKALIFVDEAESAGSSKARDALFEAMKKYQ